MQDARNALILNVDDTEAVRYAKTRALQAAGYQVLEAAGGMEALSLVAREKPALVLLDVRLPDISGIKVCEIIKQEHPQTLVLQISATFRTSADRARGLQSGADSYLTQPVSAGELAASVGALLRMRHAEDELRAINGELERRVVERTEDLRREVEERKRVEAVLVQSQKMEALGRLTGGIAHDFNNLLMGVLGNLEIMDRRLNAGRTDVQAYAGHAIDAARRAAALTQRLLAFARREPLNAGAVPVADVLRGMEGIIQTSVGAGINVRLQLPEDLWSAWCDGHQLENAVLNLIINARDAMPQGGEILITARNHHMTEAEASARKEPHLRAGDFVGIAVRDNGEGMSPATLSQAFDPFFTTKPVGKGTGLGLSMLYSFMQQSRGLIDIASTEGVGTEVSLLLPRAQAETALVTDPEPATPTAPGNGTILVVEDEPLIRALIVETLREHGYGCLETESSEQALRLAAEGVPFDLLLTDVGLPGVIDGKELAAKLKQTQPDLRIILISGHANLAQDASYADAYLPKPFAMNLMLRTVGKILS